MENGMLDNELIILAGPTGVGKTALSLELAKAIGGEIISADSIQVYKGLDIGSAKISFEHRRGIKHHLLDIWEPTEPFDVVRFQKMTALCIRQVRERKAVPILVGGTGFYIQSILKDVSFTPVDIPTKLMTELEALSSEELYEKLKEIDPNYADIVHVNNRKRVLRAVSYTLTAGEPFSVYNDRERQRTSPYHYTYFVLTNDRAVLYEQIDRRVDHMLAAGLINEVIRLKEQGCHAAMTSMQGIGYKEVLAYLDGEIDYPSMVEQIKQHTRHYAKRQLTWFKREPDVIWLSRQELPHDEQLLHTMISEIEKRRRNNG
ncbi:MAG: tRNA (adenosine(37)-N6)-dimethylallyltransferase MiaA [Lachnospiraceae bacterium]|nr:tRNA (adenosine(37)-N6)-dimethylallyltransferase MiaA [Lachnospiraceae bacterium]